MLDLKGKLAVVTGCGSNGPGWGNGKAVSVLLARQGATILGVDLSLQAAEETRKIVASEGHTMEVGECDCH